MTITQIQKVQLLLELYVYTTIFVTKFALLKRIFPKAVYHFFLSGHDKMSFYVYFIQT